MCIHRLNDSLTFPWDSTSAAADDGTMSHPATRWQHKLCVTTKPSLLLNATGGSLNCTRYLNLLPTHQETATSNILYLVPGTQSYVGSHIQAIWQTLLAI